MKQVLVVGPRNKIVKEAYRNLVNELHEGGIIPDASESFLRVKDRGSMTCYTFRRAKKIEDLDYIRGIQYDRVHFLLPWEYPGDVIIALHALAPNNWRTVD